MTGYRPIFIGLLILAIAVTSLETGYVASGKMSPLDQGVSALFSPFQKMFALGGEWLGAWLTMGSVREENKALWGQNDLLKRQLAVLENDKVQNDMFKSLLNLNQVQIQKTIPAEIIARNPSEWFHTLLINRGASDRITVNLGVFGAGGIVGRIMDVSAHRSVVRLILDPILAIPVEILPGGYQGIAYGAEADGCVVKYLPHDAAVRPGQSVVTSSFGHVFPMGLPVGTVIKVEPGEKALFKKAFVRPSADLGKIQTVMVLKP